MVKLSIRLLDIFLTGPIQLIVAYYVKNIYLRLFMIITGIGTILYNLHNYLYLDINKISKPLEILRSFVTINGKTQYHRVYNIAIMYPIFYYIYRTVYLPNWIQYIFVIEIIIGTLYNLHYLMVLSKYDKK